MALQPIAPTESVLANQIAQRLVQEQLNISKRRKDLRTNGAPAIAATEETVLPGGQVQPARPATPAVSAAVINAALAEANRNAFDAIDNDILGL